VIAIRPTTASWTFRVSSTETIDVKRTQFAIAPATAKTNHSMQGSTADPGLIAHWATPNVSETSSWLSKYVLLSRVRKLSNLLSTDLPSRADFEKGPPEELKHKIDALFTKKIAQTKAACREARKFLQWPDGLAA
jgi:hypothetical protein